MPVFMQRRKDKWVVTDDSGKVFGTYEDRDDAAAQVAAINNSIHRKEHGRGVLPGKKKGGR